MGQSFFRVVLLNLLWGGSLMGWELGAPFRDGAILQRSVEVPVWGWTQAGKRVRVEFAGHLLESVAGDDGKWMVKLPPMEASFESREMTIVCESGTLATLKDILVGEVWLASGQSNMQWTVAKSDVGRNLIPQIKERVAAGTEEKPVIREASITDYFAALHPIERATAEWREAESEMSAIAYSFAYHLFREVKVPIGILNCSFSETSIQAWTPREGFADGEGEVTKETYRKILETDPSTTEHREAWTAYYAAVKATLQKNAELVKAGEIPEAISERVPGNLAGNRDATWMFNARMNPMIPYAIQGAIWNQGYANMNEEKLYYERLQTLIKGWRKVWGRPMLPVYFHQFYSPGKAGEWDHAPTLGGAAGMRHGTWKARLFPNTGMASQIDVAGSIHYFNKALPGKRLALHALRNVYGVEVAVNGPMYREYRVEGERLIVEFQHAEGGLVVAETGSDSAQGMANPTEVPEGAKAIRAFYLADENRVWHPAEVTIEGERVILTAEGVKVPRGVSYGTAGIGFEPNLYNRDLLPMTPFILYDGEWVTEKTWPAEHLVVAGFEKEANESGLRYEWRKMPLLSTQFRDRGVLQAGVPVTFWGSVLHDFGFAAEGKAEVRFRFGEFEKTIPIEDDSPDLVEIGPGECRFPRGREWRVTVPPMEASAEPKTLQVSFFIEGELAHERIVKDLVVGEVWFVAAPPMAKIPEVTEKTAGVVRMMTRKAKRFESPTPSRYSISVSRSAPNENRFAAEWQDADGLAAHFGHAIAAKTGKPVGIILMQTGTSGNPSVNEIDLKSWIPADALDRTPSLIDDYRDLAAVRPGNEFYDQNVARYLHEWNNYWENEIPQMIKEKRAADGQAWGNYPSLRSALSSQAAGAYHIMVHSFTPSALRGVVFLTSEKMITADQGKNFGPEMTVLANAWKERFGDPQIPFLFTIPSEHMATAISSPQGIAGTSWGVKMTAWDEISGMIEAVKVVSEKQR